MPDSIISISGWLPAIIIPSATLIQLASIFRNHSAKGVSALVWFLFGIANIGLYIYTEKYTEIQSVLGLLGTALIDFIICALALLKYGEQYNTST